MIVWPPIQLQSLSIILSKSGLRFLKASPADAVGLPSALDASTAAKAFSEAATNRVRARADASVRPGRAIFLYSRGRSWRAPGTTIP